MRYLVTERMEVGSFSISRKVQRRITFSFKSEVDTVASMMVGPASFGKYLKNANSGSHLHSVEPGVLGAQAEV